MSITATQAIGALAFLACAAMGFIVRLYTAKVSKLEEKSAALELRVVQLASKEELNAAEQRCMVAVRECGMTANREKGSMGDRLEGRMGDIVMKLGAVDAKVQLVEQRVALVGSRAGDR